MSTEKKDESEKKESEPTFELLSNPARVMKAQVGHCVCLCVLGDCSCLLRLSIITVIFNISVVVILMVILVVIDTLVMVHRDSHCRSLFIQSDRSFQTLGQRQMTN